MRDYDDHRVYRTFEEFEREELRRMDAAGTPVDELLDEMFASELDFDETAARRSVRRDDDEDEDE